VAEDLRANRGSDAGGVEAVLVHDRNAVQRAAVESALQLGVALARRGERGVGSDGDESIELRLQRFDLGQAAFDERKRSELARAQPRGRLGDGSGEGALRQS